MIPQSRLQHLLFLVYLLASYYAKSDSQEASCAQAVEDLGTSNYFVSLPPHADWKLIGWDRKLSSEEKKQFQKQQIVQHDKDKVINTQWIHVNNAIVCLAQVPSYKQMCCILVSKRARQCNELVLNLNKYISQSVITQSIFQEWQQLCCSSPDLNDNGVINLSYQEHWSVFCNNLVVMHLLALS